MSGWSPWAHGPSGVACRASACNAGNTRILSSDAKITALKKKVTRKGAKE